MVGRRKVRLVVLFLSVMAALTTASVATPAPAAAAEPYIVEMYIGRCLTVYNGTGNGQQLMQWSCDGYDNGQWYFEFTDNGWAKLRNKATGKCATVYNGTGPGSPVMQWNCDGYANGQWKGTLVTRVPGRDFYSLRNRATGLCLQPAQRGYPNGILMIQAACNPRVSDQNFTWYWANG